MSRFELECKSTFQKAMQPSPANSEDGFVKENKRIIKTNSEFLFLVTGTGVNLYVV